MSNSLDADQDGHSVGLDLGLSCLQRSSAEMKVTASKERVSIVCPSADANMNF